MSDADGNDNTQAELDRNAQDDMRVDALPDGDDVQASAEAALAAVRDRIDVRGQGVAARPAEALELRHYRVYLFEGETADFQCSGFWVEGGMVFFPEEGSDHKAQAAYSVANIIGVVLMDGIEDEDEGDGD